MHKRNNNTLYEIVVDYCFDRCKTKINYSLTQTNMKAIKRNFERLEIEQPFLSTYMNFAHTINGRGFSNYSVRRQFNKLVDNEDYRDDEKRALLKHLYSLKNTPEELHIKGKKSSLRGLKEKVVAYYCVSCYGAKNTPKTHIFKHTN